MIRPWRAALIFGACLVVLLAAVAWISLAALRLERESRRQTTLEENVRLALWRMDSALGPLIKTEASRPYFAYSAFYPAERAFTRMYSPIRYGEVLVASPLLSEQSPLVLLHFQFDEHGELTSPEAPTDDFAEMREALAVDAEGVAVAAARLAQLRQMFSRSVLMAALGSEALRQVASNVQVGPQVAVQVGDNRYVGQAERSEFEQQKRSQQAQQVLAQPVQQQLNVQSCDVSEGVLTPLCVDEALLLARRVRVGTSDYIQGCWLNYDEIRSMLLREISDLFPSASLQMLRAESSSTDQSRRLTGLPLLLVPGPSAIELVASWSPLELTLLIAWGAVLLAAVAVGLLMGGVVALSERRGAFVSAVTHELRTPLTTFRLYTDLLAGGAAIEPEKRERYVALLRREAERLGHLVDNVLSYARLERRRAAASESTTLAALLDRCLPHLRERAAQAGLMLQAACEPGALESLLSVDPSAVERILLNLVDNSCKYAANATQSAIELRADRTGRHVQICVRDHGPGISPTEARRLFRPFHKSGRSVEAQAPGVGLGLALSRRLARAMGGDLRHEAQPDGGACFVLQLPSK